MLDLVAYTFAGILIGVITSLIPGMHINTIAALLLGAFYKYGAAPMPLAFIILGMAASHAFVGFVPAIFLGAPSESTVLSVAPGHRMLQKGRGYEALCLSVAGGLAGAVSIALLFPVLAGVVPAAYNLLRPSIQYIILLAVAFLILKEKRKLWALSTFLISAAFGIIALDSSINSSFVLLPVLSGLFGISTLALSYAAESAIPRQSQKARVRIRNVLPASLRGVLGGLIAGFLPGIGSSQSAVIVSSFFHSKGAKGFMVMLGAIAVTDIVLSILAIQLIGNPRSGAAVAIQEMLGNELDMKLTILFMGAGIFASGISAIIALRIGAKFRELSSAISYKNIVISSIFALAAIIGYFTGIQGLLIAATGTLIGMIPNFTGVKKSLLMGCLIAPTLLYFFGISLL